jgi:hypothetical protein
LSVRLPSGQLPEDAQEENMKTKKYPKKSHPEFLRRDVYNMRHIPNKVQILLTRFVMKYLHLWTTVKEAR